MIRFQCPSCARPWGLSNQAGGTLWTCPICHTTVNVPAGPPSAQPRGNRAHHAKSQKRKKSSAAPIPVSSDAGFELLEATGHHSPREPFIPVYDDGDESSSHTKIRKKLKKRNQPKGSSSGEIDHIAIADSEMNVVPVADAGGNRN